MRKIKVFETFSGLGSQHKALTNLEFDFEVVGISEWYIEAIISYTKVHYNQRFLDELKNCDLTKDELLSSMNGTFSSNSKTPTNLSRLKVQKLKELYVANNISKNHGSILEVKGSGLPEIDILTYSFPCQAISNQGLREGLENGTNTSSSLVWEILRILKEAKEYDNLPKTLLMENVKALLGKNYINTWNEIVDILSDIGYNTQTTIINSLNKGSVQRRERVFAVSTLKELPQFKFSDNDTKNGKTLKDILQPLTKKYDITDKFKPYITENCFMKTKVSGIVNLHFDGYSSFISENIGYSVDSKCPTLTSTGANSNIKIIDGDVIRKLMPQESLLCMGFSLDDYNKISDNSDIINYKLAGNSIVVEVLESIFKDIYEQILSSN